MIWVRQKCPKCSTNNTFHKSELDFMKIKNFYSLRDTQF